MFGFNVGDNAGVSEHLVLINTFLPNFSGNHEFVLAFLSDFVLCGQLTLLALHYFSVSRWA